jgi:hypothetical protein
MRVIRPAALTRDDRLWRLGGPIALIAVGAAAGLGIMAGLASGAPAAAASVAAALGIGIGVASLVRGLAPEPNLRAARELEALLAPAFDDAYALILLPRLPVRGRALTGLLVGPAGVRVLSVRRWEGRYRVRGRAWEFDARGRDGWIACRTNPGFEVATLADGVARWAEAAGLGQVSIAGAVAFPRRFSRVILEEPSDEVVTTENVPWWANSIGRTQRMDPTAAARFVDAVLDAGETLARQRQAVTCVARQR